MSEYQELLSKKRKSFQDLKTLNKNKKRVKKYWDETGVHVLLQKEFEKIKNNLVFDLSWRTTVEALIKYGKINDGEKILDAGCGWGRILIGLKKYLPNSEFVGIDVVDGLLEKAKKMINKEINNLNKINFYIGDVNNIQFNENYFDKVVSVRVLQYVSDPDQTIKEFRRVTKKGGRVIIIVPNKLNLIYFFKYHTKMFTPREVKNWFINCGFSDIKIGTIRFIPPWRKFEYNSKLGYFEKFCQKVPLFNKIGALIIISGRK